MLKITDSVTYKNLSAGVQDIYCKFSRFYKTFVVATMILCGQNVPINVRINVQVIFQPGSGRLPFNPTPRPVSALKT